ncbi:KLTH0C03806p [Lachancea thermotolerans CBS 6340]|uniref:KLTH0C03806p n=1 Tax=Lachancea thermotolerans (strain ATCC 56472 / CBS 6340 / NRRL Y-8284) TaxID=559295 RepID=C5DDU2_LACTC|nr:KLTH0C03806p [Lachancea thermotolerans CBS 6340]CAR21953.1 KLTH0C03806p [Lachancea thermotolerans CBS 6340]
MNSEYTPVSKQRTGSDISRKVVDNHEDSDMLLASRSRLQNPDYFDKQWKEYLFVISSMLSQLLNQAAALQANPLFDLLSEDLKAKASQQAWLMASFPLVSGSFILVSGKVGDIYGLKKTLLGGYAVVVIWSLICGLSSYAHNVDFFIVARSFQGLGIAFVLPNVTGIVGNIYKPNTKAKNMVFSMIGACAPIGATLGCLFSGLIGTESEAWAWTFYAYTIVAALNGLIAWYVIPDNIPTNVHKFKMDWLGSFLGVCGLIMFNFVWNQAPTDGWDSAYIIVLLVISVILLLIFIIFEARFAKEPLLPRAVLFNRKLMMILASLFLGWGSFGIWTYYYMAFVLNLRHYTPLWAGGSYFMFAIFGTIAAFLVGHTIHKTGPAIILLASVIAFDVGCIMLSVTPVDQTYFRMSLGTMVILSFGMDLSFPASSIILSDQLPSQYQGMAGSLVNTMINYSMSLCLGVSGTAERQVNKDGTDLLKGYRAALYVGIGLASVGIFVSGAYAIEDWWTRRRERSVRIKLDEKHQE